MVDPSGKGAVVRLSADQRSELARIGRELSDMYVRAIALEGGTTR